MSYQEKHKACPSCKGSGSCNECSGTGWIIQNFGTKIFSLGMAQDEPCMACKETGKCPECNGKGYINELEMADSQKGYIRPSLPFHTKPCPECNGTGWIIQNFGTKIFSLGMAQDEKCSNCNGSGWIEE